MILCVLSKIVLPVHQTWLGITILFCVCAVEWTQQISCLPVSPFTTLVVFGETGFLPDAGGLPGLLYLVTILLNVLTLIDFPIYRYEM